MVHCMLRVQGSIPDSLDSVGSFSRGFRGLGFGGAPLSESPEMKHLPPNETDFSSQNVSLYHWFN